MNEQHADFEQMQVEEPRRAASLTLRTDEASVARSASMDAANRSLADALRIVYRLLQVLMIALLLLFALSGLQKIDQGEQGIKVTFGEMSPETLEPGPVFSLPYPMGEIIKVSRGDQSVTILESFWPKGLDPSKPPRGLGKSSLKPGDDGSLLTGDQNIAHAQLDVSYHRENPIEFFEHLEPSSEESLVRAAVERAMVQVAAEVSIDELLRRGFGSNEPAPEGEGEASTGADSGRESSLESRVRSRAQQTLDSTIQTGLVIDRVTIREIRPPQRTLQDFRKVNDAITYAAKERVEADRQRETMLTATAGTAYRPFLDLIDAYETALAIDDQAQAELLFDEINTLLEGGYDSPGEVSINGKAYQNVRLAGEVSQLISQATQYRTTAVSSAEARVQEFEAKLAQYEANPVQFVSASWYGAFTEFLESPTVETFEIPDGSEPLRIKINPDPMHARDIERAMKRAAMERDADLRDAMRGGGAVGR